MQVTILRVLYIIYVFSWHHLASFSTVNQSIIVLTHQVNKGAKKRGGNCTTWASFQRLRNGGIALRAIIRSVRECSAGVAFGNAQTRPGLWCCAARPGLPRRVSSLQRG